MELTQPEIIQLLRKRSQMNQGEFGAKVFGTSLESGRTKIKNIELGKQTPTEKELKDISRVLGVSPSELIPNQGVENQRNGLFIPRKTLDKFEDLEVYLDMLNKAVLLDDNLLIRHIAGKIADALTSERKKALMSA
jgi:transcriptional regulator with XRE-family HTH domain